MKETIKIIFIAFFLLFEVEAGEVRTFGRSPRALLMGDAYTSIADDEFTLFYNPAILARHKAFSFTPINLTLSGTNILKNQDQFSDLDDDPQELADAAMGLPIHAGLNYSPGFKMGRFGLTAIVNQESNFSLQNQINPTLDIDHRYDKGFIAGYGMPISGDIAVGASVKYVQREAINNSYYLLGTSLLDAINAGEIEDVLDNLGLIKGSGWGVDLGVDYVKQSGSQTITFGLAALDVYTLFQTEDNEQDLEVQTQPMQINVGGSLTSTLGPGFDLKLSADIRSLQEEMEFMRRLHLGAELGLSPALSLYAGLSAIDNYSYGAMLNTGLIKLYAGFYTEEVGEELSQQDSDRFIVYVSLFHFNFDPL